jgi:hypothetical protein
VKDKGRVSILVMMATGLCLPSAAQSGATMPDGKGKQETVRICGACHNLETVTTERHDKAGWQNVVDDMVSRGADGTDEDLKMVVNYLSKYFAPKSGSSN